MSSNGEHNDFKPPPIAPALQAMIDKQQRNREAEESIRAAIDGLVSSLMILHPEHAMAIATILDGKAQKIRSEIEAKKRKDRLNER